jgi:FMS-like tyrosine kinase 1
MTLCNFSSGYDSVSHISKTVNTDCEKTSISSTDGYIFCDNSSQPDWRSNYRGDYKDQNFKPICTQDLLSWAFQVARGMEYLSQRRVSYFLIYKQLQY